MSAAAPSAPYDAGRGASPNGPSHLPNEPPPKYEEPPSYEPAGSDYPPAGYHPIGGTNYQSIIFVDRTVCFGNIPQSLTCPFCQIYVTTDVEYEAGPLTWLTSGLLCLFGCWMGCCLIPFCLPHLQDAYHRCPNCHRLLGVYKCLD